MEGFFTVTPSGTVQGGESPGLAGAALWAYLIGLIGIVGTIVTVIIAYFILRHVGRQRTDRREHRRSGLP